LNKVSKLINEYKDNLTMELRVELKLIESSVMISIQHLNPSKHYEYRIENRSVCYKIYYKQKGVIGNKWLLLNPGQSCNYIWEDPFKPHKLQVLCGDNVLCPTNNTLNPLFVPSKQFKVNSNLIDHNVTSLSSYWKYIGGINIDQTTTVNFDEIGYENELLLSHKSDSHLIVTVKSEGPIKLLLITPNLDNGKLIKELTYCSEFMKNQSFCLDMLMQEYEQLKLSSLTLLQSSHPSSSLSTSTSSTPLSFQMITQYMNDKIIHISNEQKKIINRNHMMFDDQSSSSSSSIHNHHHDDDNNDESSSSSSLLVSYRHFDRLVDIGITKLNQLEIEVLEAKELAPLVFGKMEDIYCQVFLNTDDFVLKAM